MGKKHRNRLTPKILPDVIAEHEAHAKECSSIRARAD